MKNRNLSSPILNAIVFSLFVSPAVSKADLSVPSGTSSGPVSVSTAQYVPEKTAAIAPTPDAAAATNTSPSSAAVSGQPAIVTAPPKHTAEYTVVAGDSLTKIALKFNTTRKKLRDLNNLATSVTTVKPGQILLVPSTKSAKSAAALAATAKAKAHHDYLKAQPVQDFDIPASTFASCPVPMPSEDQDAATPAPAPDVSDAIAPAAKPLAPTKLTLAPVPAPANGVPVTPAQGSNSLASANHLSQHPLKAVSYATTTAPSGLKYPAPQSFNPPTPRLTNHGFNQTPIASATAPQPASDLSTRFIQEARLLGDMGIEYDDDWRPPGEAHAWTMDCSNTSRYIYKVTTGIQLPRTASDQYYYLHLQGKAWDVPQTASGWADTNYLRQNLKPGDLLFWENTYRPERQPPITHVMVFLGTNDKGQWIMAGSQSSRGGEHNRRNGGPDIYVFRPTQACGGYTTWMGLVHHQGRFCAFGRPLEADRSKLAVAESN